MLYMKNLKRSLCFFVATISLTSCLKVDGEVEGSAASISLTNISQLPAPFNGIGCLAGESAEWDGVGWNCVVAGGSDNLGNHTATQVLNLGAFDLVGNGGTNGLRIDSAGRVSILTTVAPTSNLEVQTSIGVRNPAGSLVTLNPNNLSFNAAASSSVGISLQDINKHWSINKDVNNDLNFFDNTAGTTRLLFNGTTGNIGVGTSPVAPIQRFEVRGANAGNANFGPGQGTSSGLLVNSFGVSGDGNVMGLSLANGGRNNNSTLGWYFNILGTNVSYNVGTDSLARAGITGGFNHSQAITFSSDGNRTGGSRMSFWTGANVAAPTERMSILNSNGNIGIGIINPADRLQVFGDIRVGNAGVNGCLRDFGGGTIIGTCTSDERLKKNFRDLGSVLDKITQIKPKFYQWRSEDFPDMRFGNQEELGLVAQDLLNVFPELVTKEEGGLYKVRYQQLPLYLTKALIEQQEIIESNNVKIEKLESDLEAIKTEMSELKSLILKAKK